MSDLKPDEVIPSIIAAAIAAAGPMGAHEGQWKAKVNRAIPHITSMLNDGSRQWKTALEVLEASVFTGQYVRHEIEESSTRVMLYVDVGRPSENFPDGIESIRSHRTDNAAGRDMLSRLEKLESGDELVLWRSMEKIEGTNKSVRTLVHMETRPKRNDSPVRAPAAPAAVPDRRDGEPVESARTSDSGPRPSPYTDEINTDRLKAWRIKVRETLTNSEFHDLGLTLAESGFDFDGVSEIEWVDHVRPLVQGIINARD